MTDEELREKYRAAGDDLPQATFELVTPEFAAIVLRDKNKNNRQIRTERVNQYVRDIKRGDWKVTHQGIAFDKEGNLIDGQHRLSAVVKANIPVYMMVCRNVDHQAAAVVDIGQKRTAGQNIQLTFGKTGQPHLTENSQTAGIRKLILFNDPDRSGNSVSTLDYMVFSAKYEDHLRTVYNINHTSLANQKSADITAANLAALISGEQADVVTAANEAFGRANAKGVDRNKYNVDAALKLRHYLDELRVSDLRVKKQPMYLMMLRMIYEFAHPDAGESDFASIPNEPAYDVSKEIVELLYSTLTVKD